MSPRDPGTPGPTRWWRPALQGCAALALLSALLVAGVVGAALFSSNRTLRRFEALAARTTAGSPLAALVADPFTEECAWLEATGDFAARAEAPAGDPRAVLEQLRRAPALRHGKGTLGFMWYSLPPFGRVFLTVDYVDGAVSVARTSSLD